MNSGAGDGLGEGGEGKAERERFNIAEGLWNQPTRQENGKYPSFSWIHSCHRRNLLHPPSAAPAREMKAPVPGSNSDNA